MNNRVHGSKKIRRRSNIEEKNNYREYYPELKEDFQGICGYCGKYYKISRAMFEPDHFVPKKYSKTRINDYNNLVFSCFTCNRKKGGKWPTEDPLVCHNGDCGFIDPTSEEFDEHLSRDENGNIVPKTNLGVYMANVFQFQSRPIKEIHQAMVLYEKINNIDENASIPKSLYMELEELCDLFFDKHE